MRNPLKLEWCNEAENDKPCQQGAVWLMNKGVSILLLTPCYRSTAVKIATQIYYIKQHSWVTWEKRYKAKDHGRNTFYQSMMGNKGMIFLWMVCEKKKHETRAQRKDLTAGNCSQGKVTEPCLRSPHTYMYAYIHPYIHIPFGEAGLFVATQRLVWTCHKVSSKC